MTEKDKGRVDVRTFRLFVFKVIQSILKRSYSIRLHLRKESNLRVCVL